MPFWAGLIITTCVCAVIIGCIIFCALFWRGAISPKVFISNRTRKEINGEIIKVSYRGSPSISVGIMGTQRPLYSILIRTEEFCKPLVAKVVLKSEVGVAIANDINSLKRWFNRREKPYKVGQIVCIEYDSERPKRCNILTAQFDKTDADDDLSIISNS
ncbi:MAG: hypothetical protein FWC80_01510 [Firmicutes bacterium]|nr:hypothetical protein [Bacillota bacterium]